MMIHCRYSADFLLLEGHFPGGVYQGKGVYEGKVEPVDVSSNLPAAKQCWWKYQVVVLKNPYQDDIVEDVSHLVWNTRFQYDLL